MGLTVQQSNSPTSSEHFLVISERLGPTLQRTVNIFLIYFIDFLLFQVSSVQHCNERWIFFYLFHLFSSILGHFGPTVLETVNIFFVVSDRFGPTLQQTGKFFNRFHYFSTILGHFGPTLQQTMNIFFIYSIYFLLF